jgi:hypothetical protein
MCFRAGANMSKSHLPAVPNKREKPTDFDDLRRRIAGLAPSSEAEGEFIRSKRLTEITGILMGEGELEVARKWSVRSSAIRCGYITAKFHMNTNAIFFKI